MKSKGVFQSPPSGQAVAAPPLEPLPHIPSEGLMHRHEVVKQMGRGGRSFKADVWGWVVAPQVVYFSIDVTRRHS